MDENVPFHIQLHLTERCNLSCKHCYAGQIVDPQSWEPDELLQTIEKIEFSLNKWELEGEISLTGGEPTLYPFFHQLLQRLSLSQQIKSISILTNGVYLSSSLIESIVKANCTVQISIDGFDRSHHDFIRGNGNFDKSINTIKELVKNNIYTTVHYVLSKDSIPIPMDFIAFIKSIGVKQITFSRLVPFGSAERCKMLTTEELRYTMEMLNAYMEQSQDSSFIINTLRPLWACVTANQCGGQCPVAFQTLTILHNGDIMPCRRLPIIIGNIKQDTLFKVWYESDVLWDIRDRKKIKGCGKCQLLQQCGGARCIAYAITKDYMARDPQCWLCNE